MTNINYSGFWNKRHDELIIMLKNIHSALKSFVIWDEGQSIDNRLKIFEGINLINARVMYIYNWLLQQKMSCNTVREDYSSLFVKELNSYQGEEDIMMPLQIRMILVKTRNFLQRIQRLERLNDLK